MEYQKLIELLNEYQEEKGSEIRFKRIDNSDFFVCGDDVGLGYETILSKKFGFIKWLVDNDKIDFEKTRDKKFIWIDFGLVEGLDGYEITYTDVFLMLLSIQDNPIGFLCSVLK